jgi:hypothetical protein
MEKIKVCTKRLIVYIVKLFRIISVYIKNKFMPFSQYISTIYSSQYHNINGSLIASSINVVIIDSIDNSYQSIPLRCLIVILYERNNHLSEMNISLDFNRNSTNTSYHTMSINYDYNNFNIVDFKPIEISKIFNDVPQAIETIKEIIIKQYNLLYP